MRIGGIASGMDTEQMVKDLMRAERVRVDKYFRQEEALKWKREALNTTNKTLAEFILKARSGFGLSTTTSTGSVLSKTASSFDWVKKATSSNESAVKVTTTASAMEGTHKIKVEQLAEVASVTSGDLKGLLENGNFKNETAKSFTIETKAGKKEFKIGTSEEIKTMNQLVSAINNATAKDGKTSLGLRASYDSSLGKLMINTKEQGKEQFISINGDLNEYFDTGATVDKYNMDTLNGEVFVKLNDEIKFTVSFTEGMTNKEKADKLVNEINSSDFKEKVILYRTGDEVIIQATDGNKVKLAKLEAPVDNIVPNSIKIQDVGKNAQVQYNGGTVEKNSNNFSIFGINLQLQPSAIGEDITINVESNVDGIMDKVKSFVEDYNKLIDDINKQLNEKSYRDFQPLTKEEREAMTEKEIELWEEKAKSGLLRNDETLTRVLQTMRDGLYGSVYQNGFGEDGTKLAGLHHITQIGITTGNYQSGGKLEINEEKLRAAIVDNPDGVINLLFKKSDIDVKGTDGKVDNSKLAEKRSNSGLVERLFDDMILGMKEVVRRSGTGEDASIFRNVQSNMLIDFVTSGSISVLDRDIMNIGTRIANEERILLGRENRYWAQFTAMEKALEKMNQQSGWLQSQLGQMG